VLVGARGDENHPGGPDVAVEANGKSYRGACTTMAALAVFQELLRRRPSHRCLGFTLTSCGGVLGRRFRPPGRRTLRATPTDPRSSSSPAESLSIPGAIDDILDQFHGGVNAGYCSRPCVLKNDRGRISFSEPFESVRHHRSRWQNVRAKSPGPRSVRKGGHILQGARARARGSGGRWKNLPII